MADAETSAHPLRSAKETRRLGDAIYKRSIQAQAEKDHFGEIVAIDVDSEKWAIASTARVAAEKLRARHPEAKDVWLVRVGYRALRSFGAGSLQRTG